MFQEINAQHVLGILSALCNEDRHHDECHRINKNYAVDSSTIVNCRKLRIKLGMNVPMEEREVHTHERPLSEDASSLCDVLVSTS